MMTNIADLANDTSRTQPDKDASDVRAIEVLVARQFASLNWAPGAPADWDAFASEFFPEATLYPSARPARPQTVKEFLERMKGLVGTKLRSFHETVLGTEVRIFGNVAVAVAACEVTENDSERSRSVEMMLLVKEGGTWRIVSQAWEESKGNPIPPPLIAGAEPRSTVPANS